MTDKETESKKDVTTSRKEYEIEGKRFLVTRHFAGEKELTALVKELAVRRADREMGLNCP